MRACAWLGLTLLLLILQTTVLGFFRGNVYFDLPLIFIFSFSALHKPLTGLLWGVFLGFLTDIFLPGTFGFYMVTRGFLGAVTGLGMGKLRNKNSLFKVILMGIISFISRLMYLLLIFIRTDCSWGFCIAFMQDSIFYVLLNMLFYIPVEFVVYRINKWIAEKEISYDKNISREINSAIRTGERSTAGTSDARRNVPLVEKEKLRYSDYFRKKHE